MSFIVTVNKSFKCHWKVISTIVVARELFVIKKKRPEKKRTECNIIKMSCYQQNQVVIGNGNILKWMYPILNGWNILSNMYLAEKYKNVIQPFYTVYCQIVLLKLQLNGSQYWTMESSKINFEFIYAVYIF